MLLNNSVFAAVPFTIHSSVPWSLCCASVHPLASGMWWNNGQVTKNRVVLHTNTDCTVRRIQIYGDRNQIATSQNWPTAAVFFFFLVFINTWVCTGHKIKHTHTHTAGLLDLLYARCRIPHSLINFLILLGFLFNVEMVLRPEQEVRICCTPNLWLRS